MLNTLVHIANIYMGSLWGIYNATLSMHGNTKGVICARMIIS